MANATAHYSRCSIEQDAALTEAASKCGMKKSELLRFGAAIACALNKVEYPLGDVAIVSENGSLTVTGAKSGRLARLLGD